jgi:hypothetical protein
MSPSLRAIPFSSRGQILSETRFSATHLRARRRSHSTVETRKSLWGILPRRVRESSGGAKAARQLTFISCWHLNDHESQGMWRLYVGGSEGVAICSRFGALADCLTKNPRNEIYLGCVKYIDYQKDQLSDDWVTPFVHKRLSFRHESELRAVIFARSRPQAPPAEEKLVDGVSVEVDLNAAIDAVYTSPYAPIWFHNLVVSISKRFGLNVPIRLSALRAEPIY